MSSTNASNMSKVNFGLVCSSVAMMVTTTASSIMYSTKKKNYTVPRIGLLNSRYEGIGLYRDVWIAAIASSTTSLATRTAAICVRFQGRRVRREYVTMQITFLTRKSALIYRRGLRQRVASLTLNCNGDSR